MAKDFSARYDEDEEDNPRRSRKDLERSKKLGQDPEDDDYYDEDDAEESDIHPAFLRDKYLMRQKVISISDRYSVMDAKGRELLYVKRPAHLLQNLFCLFATIMVLFAAIGAGVFLMSEKNTVPGIVVMIIGIPLAILVFGKTVPRRHITFYADREMKEPLLRALQDQKFVFINAWYTLVDENGEVIARFRKNYLYDMFRKQWKIYDPDGEIMLTAKEDSLVLSILRRTIGSITESPLLAAVFGGIFRTNFIFLNHKERKIGEFNRKFTLLDRYVLDMTADPDQKFDRRIAVALGVLLDTGENR